MSGPVGQDTGVGLGRHRGGAPVRVLAVVALIVTACMSGGQVPPASDADPNGEVTSVLPNIPIAGIDPQRSSTGNQLRNTMMVFEALMTLDPKTLKPIPAAAKSPPTVSADGLTYTFTLRDGLTYSDGSPLTARDFAYGFTRLCDPANASPYAFSGYVIVGCATWNRMDLKRSSAAELAAAKSRLGLKANGDRELVIMLTEPAAYFPLLAAIWVGAPARESDVATAGDRYGGPSQPFIGNGAFKLVEWIPERRLVFERNERYRTPAKLKRWTKIAINDPTVAFGAYRNNEIDFYDITTDDLAAIDRDADLRAQLIDRPGSSTSWIQFNTARTPFTDVKVRQAFAKAIDREAWVRDLAKINQPAYSIIPPGHAGHDPADRFQAFDPAAARQLLQSSTFFGKPELTTIRIVIRSDRPAQRVEGEWLQQQWKSNLGIEIALEALDRALLAQRQTSVEARPQVELSGWLEDYPDPQDWLTTVFHSSSAQAMYQGYADPTFDRLVKDADRESDPQKRADLYQQASRLLSQDAPAAWLAWTHVKFLQKPWVKGVTLSADDYEYGFFRLSDVYVTKGKK